MEATYTVVFSRLPELREKLARLHRRAEKLGVPPVTLELLEEVILPAKGMGEDGPKVKHLRIRLTGETPKLAGWTFAAVIECLEHGNVLHAVPGHEGEIPEKFREVRPWCDHCRTERRRLETYIVRSDAGEWKQVGSTCIQDFLGGIDPHKVASWIEYLRSAEDTCDAYGSEDGMEGTRRDWMYSPLVILEVAALCIRENGWLSRKRAEEEGAYGRATADQVRDLFTDMQAGQDSESGRKARQFRNKMTDEDRATAAAALAWAAGLSGGSDFERNLAVLAQEEMIEISGRSLGIMVAAVPCYARAVEKELAFRKWAKISETSTYQGTVKARGEFRLTILSYRALDGDFGTTHMYKMVDEAGNLFVWFGSRPLDMTVQGSTITPRLGDEVVVRATVKKHEEFRGTKQTILTRAALLEVVGFKS